MPLHLSHRHEWVIRSEIRNMSIECDRIGGINLSQGVCDTKVPPEVLTGAKEAIDNGVNSYTRYDGLSELREGIALKQKRFTGVDVDPENEIIVTAGSTGALYCACLALLNPADEVIVFEPYYGYHVSTLIATEVVPVYVEMKPPGWRFTRRDLEAALSPRTRAILINTPANPSGKVFERDELETIADFAIKHDLFVFTDEIYEHFVYDGLQHISASTLPQMKERTVTVSGFSKTYSITGWRIGYCICDSRWTRAIGYFSDLVYVCAPAPLQVGVARGLLGLGPDFYSNIAKEYVGKRDMICECLTKVGFSPYVPSGAYYVLCDISPLPGTTSKEKAMCLLQRTGVACVPGEAFYSGGGGENMARFCFAKENVVLSEACRRLATLQL
jgi:aminotransferase